MRFAWQSSLAAARAAGCRLGRRVQCVVEGEDLEAAILRIHASRRGLRRLLHEPLPVVTAANTEMPSASSLW